MTNEDYAQLIEMIERTGVRCTCCDRIVNHCPWWQQIRMTVDPLPGEAAFIDSRREQNRKRGV